MANEFHYAISLKIVHPSADPKAISEVITELHPQIEAKAGSECKKQDGTAIMPRRTARLSVWIADLHDEERLFSGDRPISEFILGQLDRMKGYRNLFAQLRQEGQVMLTIDWFCESNYSAGVLTAETLEKCGDLGLGIELYYYGPSSS